MRVFNSTLTFMAPICSYFVLIRGKRIVTGYWTFVDMNSYFASCEQQERPELRGLPVGVVPVMAETTCFIAASYEAKVFKIKPGRRSGKAASSARISVS